MKGESLVSLRLKAERDRRMEARWVRVQGKITKQNKQSQEVIIAQQDTVLASENEANKATGPKRRMVSRLTQSVIRAAIGKRNAHGEKGAHRGYHGLCQSIASLGKVGEKQSRDASSL